MLQDRHRDFLIPSKFSESTFLFYLYNLCFEFGGFKRLYSSQELTVVMSTSTRPAYLHFIVCVGKSQQTLHLPERLLKVNARQEKESFFTQRFTL